MFFTNMRGGRVLETFQYNAVQYNTTTNYDLSNKHIVELIPEENVELVADLLYWITLICIHVTDRRS